MKLCYIFGASKRCFGYLANMGFKSFYDTEKKTAPEPVAEQVINTVSLKHVVFPCGWNLWDQVFRKNHKN